jgi:hypothetical protein
MRFPRASAVVLLAVLACGCSASQTAPHATTARSVSQSLPAGCGDALAIASPLTPPATANQAADDYATLSFEQDPGTVAASYMRDLQADASQIGMALDTNLNPGPGINAWNRDMQALTTYCGS